MSVAGRQSSTDWSSATYCFHLRLRPHFVACSACAYQRRVPLLPANNGTWNQWAGGLSLQYSIRYLQSQVKDFGLPEFVNRLTPLVEVAWSSAASRPNQGSTQYLIAPGINYTATNYAFSIAVTVEALIPGNKQTGSHVGAIAQFHLYFDDLFPTSLGKPIVNWWN